MTHTPEGPGTARFECLWSGCAKRETAGAEQERWLTHLRVHSAYRPYVCTVPGCAHASAGPPGLIRHMRSAHGVGAEQPELRCEWDGCTAPTPPDAPALLTHLLADHRRELAPGVRCSWRGCSHTFTQRSSLGHLEGHCPPLHTYECPACNREFSSRQARKKHVAAAHPSEGDAELPAGTDRVPMADPVAASTTRKRATDPNVPQPKRRRVDNDDNDARPGAGDAIASNHRSGSSDTGARSREQLERTIEELTRAKTLAESRVRELEACLRAARREAADWDDWEYCT